MSEPVATSSVTIADPAEIAALLGIDDEQAWQAGALCAQFDPDQWFPREAKKICAQCPERAPCLQYALSREERHGVWGGLSERERRRIVRRRVA